MFERIAFAVSARDENGARGHDVGKGPRAAEATAFLHHPRRSVVAGMNQTEVVGSW